MSTALITGASAGLGLALARRLADDGWALVLTARDAARLHDAAPPGAILVPGDVADPDHRRAVAAAVAGLDAPLDLLVNNASTLGPTPLPALVDLALDDLRRVLEVDLLAPLALVQAVLPHLAPDATVVDVSSDAATTPYAGWGAYGCAKAALDQLSAVLAVEHPELRVVALDPGDMRTAMHQAAFPGEDISDRPLPETVVPALLAALHLPSGRYVAADLLAGAVR